MTDSWNRTDSALLMGTPDFGPDWVAHAGVWGISSNLGYCAAVVGDSYVGANLSAANIDQSYLFPTQGTSAGSYIRWSDNSNNIVIIRSGGTVVYKKVAGSYTQIMAGAGGSPGPTQVLHLTANGSALESLFDTSSEGTCTESVNSSATDHGLFTNGNGATRWNNYNVDAIAAGGRTTKNTRANPLGVNVGMGWRMGV